MTQRWFQAEFVFQIEGLSFCQELDQGTPNLQAFSLTTGIRSWWCPPEERGPRLRCLQIAPCCQPTQYTFTITTVVTVTAATAVTTATIPVQPMPSERPGGGHVMIPGVRTLFISHAKSRLVKVGSSSCLYFSASPDARWRCQGCHRPGDIGGGN